jgi:hypothetical protein
MHLSESLKTLKQNGQNFLQAKLVPWFSPLQLLSQQHQPKKLEYILYHSKAIVHNSARLSVSALVARIKDEAAQFATDGAARLRVVLPETWDVH